MANDEKLFNDIKTLIDKYYDGREVELTKEIERLRIKLNRSEDKINNIKKKISKIT